MNQYEVEPVAILAQKLLVSFVGGELNVPLADLSDHHVVEACYLLAEEYYREGVKRGWIKMDPVPEENK